MISQQQSEALVGCYEAARASGHVWPGMAACEAMVESAWCTSQLYRDANNVFGQKQSHPASGESLILPTREYLHGSWTTVQAVWKKFSKLDAAFTDRMALLRRLAPEYPHYATALVATTAEQYVVSVSESWSTDPFRARTCTTIFQAHQDILGG